MQNFPETGPDKPVRVNEDDNVAQQAKGSAPSENRLAQFLQRSIRWLLGILILIGLGYILAVVILYIPARQELEKVQLTISSELDQARLHEIILSIRSDVAAARLAIAKGDIPGARIALNHTDQTLSELQNALADDQRQAAEDMLERLKLALDEIGINNDAAESDLGVLATDLLELENAYFVRP